MCKYRFVSSFQVIKTELYQYAAREDGHGIWRCRILNIRLVAMAEGFHAFPYRTRPLSLPAPMVLGPKGPGREDVAKRYIFPDSSVGRALDC